MPKIMIRFMTLLLATLTSFSCSNSKADNPPGIAGRTAVSASSRTPDFVTLAKSLRPVVVNISTMQAPRQPPRGPESERLPPGPGTPGAPDQQRDPMEDFLEKYFGRRAPQGDVQQRSLGSGFIIGSDGSILTNAHVVENAKKIVVKLSDKREFEAKVVGKDPKTDVAVIKIDSKESLPQVRLGDSDRLEVGEWVMAVGNPFGLDNSITSGIVSAKGRHIGAGPYDDFIQTDASVNPGNSGGPLVNGRGEVVGINIAIVSQTGGNVGIAFATPINLVKEVLSQLATKGTVTRGWAGLAIQEVTPDIAEAFGLEAPRGALVAGVVKGGPAEQGGIKVGDIVTEYDGHQVKNANDFPLMVARTPVNKNVQMKVFRETKEMAMSITVGELKDSQTGGAGKG
jgi:serine protease Do